MKKLAIILIVLLAYSCGSQKEAVSVSPVQDIAPSWVGKKPIEYSYYSGIGMAVKTSSLDYLSIAKNNALQDLSSEISVKINSTSVLYQVEQNDVFREEFKANTRLHSLESLEGFELVDTYENSNEYWVYYRLSKEKFNQIKIERKQKALSKSLDLFAKAKEYKKNWEYDDALIYTIKALESVKDYMGDALLIDLDGENVYYGNTLYSFLNSTINEIEIRPLSAKVDVVRGNGISSDQIVFLVSADNNRPLSGLPVYFYYSGKRIKNNEVLTNSFGNAEFSLDKVISLNKVEYFQANLNMVQLSKEATDDPFVRKIVAKTSGPSSRMEININSPSVYIKTTETSFGKEQKQQILAGTFSKEFLDAGFIVVNKLEDANYLLQISSETEKISSNSGFYSASLKADINFFDNNLKLLYTNQIVNMRGVQLDYDKASEDAYKKASEEIQKRIFRDLRRKVFE